MNKKLCFLGLVGIVLACLMVTDFLSPPPPPSKPVSTMSQDAVEPAPVVVDRVRRRSVPPKQEPQKEKGKVTEFTFSVAPKFESP